MRCQFYSLLFYRKGLSFNICFISKKTYIIANWKWRQHLFFALSQITIWSLLFGELKYRAEANHLVMEMFQMNVNLFFYGREEEGVCYDDLTDFDTSKSIRKLYLPFFISSNKSTLSPSKMYCSNHTNCNVSNVYHKIITRHFYATSKRNWFIINNNVPIFHFNLSATKILCDEQ